MVHVETGNIPKFTVMSQNIPKGISPDDKVIEIQQILLRFSPDVIFIAEARADEVGAGAYDGYVFAPGHLENGKNSPRISVLYKSSLQVLDVVHLREEVPNVHLKIQFGSEMYSVSSGYREWSYDGVLRNRNEELQEQRWRSFLAAWHTTFGRLKNKLILGDFNISMLEPQAYPKLKEIIAEYVTSTGCRQLINQPTRVQGTCTPSLLDIIYTNVPDKGIIKIITKFVTISDHLLVGVVLKPVVMSTTCP